MLFSVSTELEAASLISIPCLSTCSKIIMVITLQLLFKAQLKPEEMKTTLPRVTRNWSPAVSAVHRYGMAGV